MRESYRNKKFDRFMHKIVLLALLVKTARTVSLTVYRYLRCFLVDFVFYINKLAFKTLNNTLNDQFLKKTFFFMLRYGSRSYNFSMLKKGNNMHFCYATVDAKLRF
jgi:hypothetical protein